MRPWFLLALVTACGDDPLPDFATGDPPFAIDAGVLPLDAGVDARVEDAGDAAFTARGRTGRR